MDRVLSGQLQPHQRCDPKTLAQEPGVTRTGFYPRRNADGSVRPGPYQHLAREFQRRLAALQQAGTIADPRGAQIERLKHEVDQLGAHLARQESVINQLTEFKQRAVSQLAAQHAEIEHLRSASLGPTAVVRSVPTPHRPRL
ncbi:hypothetical protein [Streptomyces sp. HC307]|uniref:hypothetical protein n=1 Tax=Streptomyces flavusporus TaxID=3385496 RepID=UPI00391738DC